MKILTVFIFHCIFNTSCRKASRHLKQSIAKPGPICIPKTCSAKTNFFSPKGKYHSTFPTLSHQSEVIFKPCCFIAQRQNPIISPTAKIFSF